MQVRRIYSAPAKVLRLLDQQPQGVAELLRPEVLGWAGTPGEAPNAASARNQGSPDANAALGRGK